MVICYVGFGFSDLFCFAFHKSDINSSTVNSSFIRSWHQF